MPMVRAILCDKTASVVHSVQGEGNLRFQADVFCNFLLSCYFVSYIQQSEGV